MKPRFVSRHRSPGAKRRPLAGPSPQRSEALCSLRDLLHAGRRGALRTLLGLVLDLRALLERAVAVALDRAEMDEHVVRAVVGCDESVALVVAEPLDGSGRHLASSSLCCERGGCELQRLRAARHNLCRFHRPDFADGSSPPARTPLSGRIRHSAVTPGVYCAQPWVRP